MLNDAQFDQLKREYAMLMMESMDFKTMEQFVLDTIYDNLEMAKEDELKEDIKDLCGDDVLFSGDDDIVEEPEQEERYASACYICMWICVLLSKSK